MRYFRLEKIGDGGQATVYRARDENGRVWALKKLLAPTPETAARFRREVRIQQSLKHDNIVPVVAANVTQAEPFYVMPLADSSLEALIPTYAATPSLFQPIAAQLLDALHYAHEQGILHRDLKPRNILMCSGVPRISDFGLGKVLDGDNSYKTNSGENAYTYWYAPPEQILKGLRHCDNRSDIYSLGKLFLHCLAGGRVSDVPAGLDNHWQFIIRRALRDSMDDRWPSVTEMRRQFDLVFGLNKPLVIDPDDLIGKLAHIASQTTAVTQQQAHDFASQVGLLKDDEVLLKKVFVRVPSNLAQAWLRFDPNTFRAFVEAYDAVLEGGLGFEYCDTVADHYLVLFPLIGDFELRQLMFRRLFGLGPGHNRWHVGHVFAEALKTVVNPAEREFIIALAQSDERKRRWNRSYVASNSLIDKRIRDAFAAEPADAEVAPEPPDT